MMKLQAYLAVGGLISVLTACDREAAARTAPLDVGVADSAGISIVQNLVYNMPRLRLEEVRRIGLVDGELPYLFSEVGAVAVSSLDTIFVANSQSGTVRVFAPEGRFVREFGGLGEGPHEVRGVSDLWLTGDTVVVRDSQPPWKTVLFASAGTYLDSWPGARPGALRLRMVAHGEAGWVAEVWPDVSLDGAPGDSVGDAVELRGFLAADRSLGARIFEPPRRATYITPNGRPDQALFRVFGSAFDGRGGFYRTGASQYEIRVYAPDGALKRLIRRSYEPRVLGPRDIDEFRRLVQEVLDTTTSYGPPGSIDEQVMRDIDQTAALPLPAAWSPIRELLVSADGWIWAENVEAVVPGTFELINIFGFDADYRTEPSDWDVFDPEGVLLGQVRLPASFDPMAVRGLEITGVQTDGLDVEYVVTYVAARRDQPSG